MTEKTEATTCRTGGEHWWVDTPEGVIVCEECSARPRSLEARCGKCGETFIPANYDADWEVHITRASGDDCGGEGTITRVFP